MAHMSLANKVAIVTGGNSGIGKAVALELAKQGASLVIDYVSHPDAAEAVEAQITALGAQVIGVQADVSKLDDLQRLFAAAVDKFGRVDIMVNNAGVETRASILDTTEADYDKVLNINLKSAFFGTQLAAKQMIKQGGGGRIINMTSIHEDWPMPGNTAYCLSKGGMRMLTRTAAVELAAPPGAAVKAVSTVVGIDPIRKTIALNGPDNKPETMSVPDTEMSDMKDVKVGDNVEVNYTKAVAISLDPVPVR